jgi:hypothetical protein
MTAKPAMTVSLKATRSFHVGVLKGYHGVADCHGTANRAANATARAVRRTANSKASFVRISDQLENFIVDVAGFDTQLVQFPAYGLHHGGWAA